MRMTVAGLELDVALGVSVAELVTFARERGRPLPDRPWCGPSRLHGDHRVGTAPLVAFARLSSQPVPDARPQPGAHLAVVGGPDAGLVATIAEGMTVGRGSACALRLSDPTVGEAHARFAAGRIADLGSPNGTVVAGRRARWRTRVADGDVVTMGDTAIAVRLGGPPGDGPPGDGPPGDEAHGTGSRNWGMASGLTAGLGMAVFAFASGNWVLGAAVLAVPAAMGMAAIARRRRSVPVPVLDATATLGLPPLPAGPVAVSGPRGLLRAVFLATGRPPTEDPHWEDWMALLPPARHEVAWVASGGEVPSWARVRVASEGDAVVVSADGESARGPLPLMTASAADAVARRVAALAAADSMPSSMRWAELPPPSAGLAVRLGIGESGPVFLDLVADGPHVLMAGTTGSGKSQALQTIIASLANDFSPDDVTFALIDFKGGAGLGPCAELPHVGSVLTDLEPHLARRCLLALQAELADRKRAAAAAGVTSFELWTGPRPPRLVVVVDEFQEIAAADRDFLPALARLAAQGRSLGIHLVLATQRPAGAVGADIRANIATTLALRTASESESADLIGSAAAAAIPPDAPGRALLARAGELVPVQVALPLADPPPRIREMGEPSDFGRSLLESARESCARDGHARRASALWLPPLPDRIAPAAVGGWVLGVADLPARRAREQLEWDPGAGPLVVTGPPRSGRTGVLRAAAAAAERSGLTVAWLPSDARLAVRTLALALETPNSMVVVDDAARVLSLAATADAEVTDLLLAATRVMPVALAVPPGWAAHRLAIAGLRLVLTGLAEADDAAWEVPRELRGLPPLPGRVRASDASGWREAQLSVAPPWVPTPLVAALPLRVEQSLPPAAIGIGGDRAMAIELPSVPATVVGPAGNERDSIARRVALATGHAPMVAESPFALANTRATVVVRPTARTVREVTSHAPHGLVEPTHVPFRAVLVVDAEARAVQVLPG